MTEYQFKIEFPCGYKFSLYERGWSVGELDIDDPDLWLSECPLHGKNCSKKK